VGFVVTSRARETFTPHELTAAYEYFTKRGGQYLDAKRGFRVAAYRFEGRMLVVYQESETGVVVLSLPGSGKEFPPELGLTP
jgi:hypothetical protein